MPSRSAIAVRYRERMVVDGGCTLYKIVVFSDRSAVDFMRAAMRDGDRALVDEPDEECPPGGVDLSALVAVLHLDEATDAYCFALNGAGSIGAESETVQQMVRGADAFVLDLVHANASERFASHIRRAADELAAKHAVDCPIVVRAAASEVRAFAGLAVPVVVDAGCPERDVVRSAVDAVAKRRPEQRPA